MPGKTIITAAITGAVHIPSMSEYLPVTEQQIIDNAVAAAEAGAAAVHIHGRDETVGGKPTGDPDVIARICEAIRKRCDVLIGITTGGAVGMTDAERIAAVPRIKPELASCNAGSMNFSYTPVIGRLTEFKNDWEKPLVMNTYKNPFNNTFSSMEEFIRVMNENNVKPEFEVYDAGQISNVAYFYNKSHAKPPLYLQFVLGIMGGMPATPDNLLFLYNTAKANFGDNFVWSCGVAGKAQFKLMSMVLAMGGNVRVGLEDNLYLKKGVLAKNNGESVTKMRRIAELLDCEIASPAEAKQILGINR